MPWKDLRGWAAGIVCLALSACGGGGGGNSTTEAPTLPTTLALAVPARAEVGADVALASQPSGLSGLAYHWSFGDGSTSDTQAPTHRFNEPGTYEVTLTVSTPSGQSRSAAAQLMVGHFANTAGAVCSLPDGEGWCWQAPRPTGNRINKRVSVDGQTAWAVGSAGLILRTEDGGKTWAGQHSGVRAGLLDAAFADAQVGWVVGGKGTVLKTTDGGATWSLQALPDTGNRFDPDGVWVLDRNTAVVSAPSGRTYVTTDGGFRWSESFYAPERITQGRVMWFSDRWGQVGRSEDLGKTWVLSSLPGSPEYGSFLAGADDASALVFGMAPATPADPTSRRVTMWLTRDGGHTWVQSMPAAMQAQPYVNAGHLLPSGVAWASAGDSLYRSTDWGATWAVVPLPPPVVEVGHISGLMALGDDSATLMYHTGVYLTTDRGATWRFIHVPAEERFTNPCCALPKLTIVDEQHHWLELMGRHYRSSNAGQTFTLSLGGAIGLDGVDMTSAWFFDARQGLVLSSTGAMYRTANGGVTWSAADAGGGHSSPGNRVPARIQFVSRERGWFNVPGTASFRSTADGGLTWTAVGGPFQARRISDFHFVNARDGWAIAPSGQVYRSQDAGETWSLLAQLAGTFYGIRFIDAETGIAVGSSGVVMRTTDGGRTWSAASSGTSDELMRVHFADGLNGWALGNFETVIRTADGGRTWSPVALPMAGPFRKIFFVDALRGWLLGQQGAVLATTDGGRTWVVKDSGTEATLQDVFFTDPYTGWMVGSRGTTLATVTGG